MHEVVCLSDGCRILGGCSIRYITITQSYGFQTYSLFKLTSPLDSVTEKLN